MNILAIETSCDETAAAVVKEGQRVRSNVIASQIALHAATGGVVPEVAAREHVLKMLPVLDQALIEAECGWKDIEALAVTQGPGLISSLIIGTETANVISYVKQLPLVPVHHIVGHLYSNWLEVREEIRFPVLVLTVSGGHNELVLMRGHGEYEVLGETRDDAAGEAFDKVARLLGLGYPGGPAISRMAEQGDPGRFALPRAYLGKGSLDFSFSGLKTAVLTAVKEHGVMSEQDKADLAASFQEAVVTVLADKVLRALKVCPGVKEVHLAGGVSANTRLREVLKAQLPEDMPFRFPAKIAYCTDNAAMIAAAGYFQYTREPKRYRAGCNIVPFAEFTLER